MDTSLEYLLLSAALFKVSMHVSVNCVGYEHEVGM